MDFERRMGRYVIARRWLAVTLFLLLLAFSHLAVEMPLAASDGHQAQAVAGGGSSDPCDRGSTSSGHPFCVGSAGFAYAAAPSDAIVLVMQPGAVAKWRQHRLPPGLFVPPLFHPPKLSVPA